MILRYRVKGAARLVKHRDRAVLRKSPRRQYLLVLPARKYHALLGELTGENCLFLKRLTLYLLIHIRQLKRPLYLFPILLFIRMPSHQNIFFNGIGKNFSVLKRRGKQVPVRLYLIFPDINAVHQNPTLAWVVEPHQQFHQRAFPGAVVPRQRHALTALDLKVNVPENPVPLFISKRHMLKFHAAYRKFRQKPFLIFRDRRLMLQKMSRLLQIQAVLDNRHHRIRKPDQRPCVGVHGRLDHRHLRKHHRTAY